MDKILVYFLYFLIFYLVIEIIIAHRHCKQLRAAEMEWEKVKLEAETVLNQMNAKPFGTKLGSEASK